MTTSYTSKDIQVYNNDIDKIRVASRMYIGYTEYKAFLHMIKEILQNSIDECCVDPTKHEISLFYDERNKQTIITDTGRGIPIDSIVDVATVLQAGGKFESMENSAYGISAGLVM